MKAVRWIKKIREATVQAGTYRPYFDEVIKTLAEILEKRDDAEEIYQKNGGIPLVEHTNTHGATNVSKNPALMLWDDLNKSALAYWRDLGLTPAGLKKIDETAMQPKRKSTIAEVLKEIGSEKL